MARCNRTQSYMTLSRNTPRIFEPGGSCTHLLHWFTMIGVTARKNTYGNEEPNSKLVGNRIVHDQSAAVKYLLFVTSFEQILSLWPSMLCIGVRAYCTPAKSTASIGARRLLYHVAWLPRCLGSRSALLPRKVRGKTAVLVPSTGS